MNDQNDSARAESQGQEEEPTRDAIRSWVDYKGHVPRTLQMTTPDMQGGGGLADFLRGLGVQLSEAAQAVTLCAVCDVDWPCKHAIRAERDASEKIMQERGERLRAAGVAVDDGPQPFHPDKATPRGRALMQVQQEILRQSYQDAAQAAAQLTNLILFHPFCTEACHGNHHTENLLLEPFCCEYHAGQRVAGLLGNSYGVAYLSHDVLPADQQESAKRAYSERYFTTIGMGNGLGEPADPSTAHRPELTAVAAHFYVNTPLNNLRALTAEYEAQEERKDLAAARAEGNPAGQSGSDHHAPA